MSTSEIRRPAALRWIAVTIFVFSAVLNYLDRQVLATMAEVWSSRNIFAFTSADYGLLLSVFSIAYAASALFAGSFLDRVGLNRGVAFSVALWACASFGTGMSHNVKELLIWRTILGIAEASGVSAVGKAVGLYLYPNEQAVGTAMGQLGLSLGGGLAPGFAVYFAYHHDWRWTFYAVGILSLAWIPVWFGTARTIPPTFHEVPTHFGKSFELLRDPRLWALMLANFLSMTLFSLWTNWPPRYLVRMYHLTPPQTATYTWIVPLCGYAGAMVGGSISWRLIRRGWTSVAARKRACLFAALGTLATAAIPFMPNPALATLGMSLSFFCINAWSANHYTLPIDIYGAARSAFAIGGLLVAYGMMQFVISAPLARVTDLYGFKPVCLAFAFLPLCSYWIVRRAIRDDAGTYDTADRSASRSNVGDLLDRAQAASN